MIEFQGVSKSYAGTLALDTLVLTVARGELLVLIGALSYIFIVGDVRRVELDD